MQNVTTLNPYIIGLSILLCVAVLLSGVHAKELAGFPLKQLADDSTSQKIHVELHNHVDKQTVHSLLKISGDTQQADHRAFRHVRHEKDELDDLKDKLFGIWNRMKVAASFLTF